MILVTYLSETGNTRKVASAIHGAIGCPVRFIEMNAVDLSVPYDLIFAGFPVWQFGPAGPARKFLASLPPGQKVALFVTHAMDPQSDDPAVVKMLDAILEKCRRSVTRAELCGFFHCRGELAESTAHMLADSRMPMLVHFAAMRSETLGHPDDQELEAARQFAAETLRRSGLAPGAA